jgi:hypothetical protein
MLGARRLRTTVAFVALLVGLVVPASSALAAPGAVQDLAGCSANTLAPNDDESTGLVPLGFTAHVFDTSFSSVYVNNNGNITVDDPLGDFTPFDFRETGQSIIAPFFADVDTRGAGSGTTDYGPTTVDGHAAFCVIWNNVGYFASHDDLTNRFQLLLVDRGSAGVDVIFNYDRILWETGDASNGSGGFGGTSAASGYAAGDGDSAHSLMLPGSFTNGGLLDSNPSTSLANHSTAGRGAGSYLFSLRQSAPTGGKLTGVVKTPGGSFVSGSPVQMCLHGGACVTRIANASGVYTGSNLPAGTYDVTGFPGSGSENSKATVANVGVGGPGSTTTQDITLGDPPPAPPEGTTITNIGTTGSGIPIAYWEDPLALSTQGCPGGTATYQFVVDGHLVRQGGLTEGPAGTYTTTVPAVAPDHGNGEMSIHIVCPAGPAEDTDFGVYIDPSGAVRDTNGVPIDGAQVTLLRSASADGPFFPIPDGSAIMSPSNRTNPVSTNSDGRFGWDVVAGYYVVSATKEGCHSAADPSRPNAVTGVLTIPPAVTNVDLRLNCGESAPAAATPPATQPPVVIAKTPKRTLIKLGAVKLVKGKVLVVRITCAKSAKKACKGKVSAKIGKKAVGSHAFSKLKRGKSAAVKITLSKKGRALVKKAKKGKKIPFAVSVAVSDAAGSGAIAKRTVGLRR